MRALLSAPLARFIAFGLGLHVVAALAGFMPASGIAKSAVWWLTAGSAVMLLCRRLGPSAPGRAWLLLTLIFSLDIGVQGIVRGYFGAGPQPGVIAESLAHTTPSEMLGFVLEQWQAIGKCTVLVTLACAAAWHLRPAPLPAIREAPSRRARTVTVVVLAVAAALHFNSTMLRAQPVLRWGVVYARHTETQREISRIDADRAAVQARSREWQVSRLDEGPRTVVLVIGESATRLNWGALGYARDTTAPLTQALAALPGRSVIFKDAWSAEAFTLPSLRLALTPATAARPQDWSTAPDVTQLAQGAGYQVTWLSNQPAHEGWFASMARTADRSVFINKGNWRDSSATDQDLLPPLGRLLEAAPAPRELLVVHLLGQHFHYRQRCPQALRRWSIPGEDDHVARALREAGRSSSIVQARNEYDDALLCGSDFLAQLLGLLERHRKGRAVELLYFSDHGQEVGHVRDFAGHSGSDESGYAIPMLWWSREGRLPEGIDPEQLAARPFRLDWADHLIQHLLGIRSTWYRPELDLLSPTYGPGEPARPAALRRGDGAP